jgi:hypothetical protein
MPMPELHRRSERDRIETAYLILLTLPHGVARASLQPVLAGLRDQIAAMTQEQEQDVQDRFELMASKRPLHLS